MQNQPSEALLQVQLLRAQLEQIQRVKEFLKNLQPGRKIYIDLGGVMVESNYLEAMEYLEEKEKEIRELLLKLESQINLKQFQVK
jgi:chaperonin cofactor prefoldin